MKAPAGYPPHRLRFLFLLDTQEGTLVSFAEAFDIPIVETQGMVCGNFPKKRPLYLGSRLEPFMATSNLVLGAVRDMSGISVPRRR